MRKVENKEIKSYRDNPDLNPEGLGLAQVKKLLQKKAATEALRNASSIAHLKLIIQWLIENA